MYKIVNYIHNKSMKIKDIMSKNVISCDVNSEVTELARIMKENNVGFVIITKEDKIIGVITDRDIVVRILANKDNKIDGYYTKNFVTIDEDEDYNKALVLMRKHKIKRLLITNKNGVSGVISISDIMTKTNVYDTIQTIWSLETNTKEGNVKVDDFKL